MQDCLIWGISIVEICPLGSQFQSWHPRAMIRLLDLVTKIYSMRNWCSLKALNGCWNGVTFRIIRCLRNGQETFFKKNLICSPLTSPFAKDKIETIAWLQICKSKVPFFWKTYWRHRMRILAWETEDGGDMKMLWREAIYMAGTVGTGWLSNLGPEPSGLSKTQLACNNPN
jgi:hypothetical protein